MKDTATIDATAPPDDPVRIALEDTAVRARIFAAAREILWGRFGDPEEIAQQALELAWEKRATFVPGGSVAAWVIGYVRKLALVESRRRRLAPLTEDRPALSPPESDELSKDEDLAALGRLMGQLPAKLREAVELRYLKDLEYDDIAARLGISADNARQRASRGMHQLKTLAAREGRS